MGTSPAIGALSARIGVRRAEPDDDKFLACAIAAQVSLIVSGDKHLLRLNGWGSLTIITPREFVDWYLEDAEGRGLE